MQEKRVISPGAEGDEEQQFELSLRPKWLREYIGQKKAKDNLEVFIKAARKRAEALDHLLPRPKKIACAVGQVVSLDPEMNISYMKKLCHCTYAVFLRSAGSPCLIMKKQNLNSLFRICLQVIT